ncbi:hypothetical protein Moror_15359 [Moniliophthora roreri MCA 2997]|uniref:Protein kinase domain-containing protein n=1 Tax=Moniliophthora roreri (strain MCA 2997) TaxID=1381753 RepID=V2Y7X4_MONRO|nr:hypothetical protein Moror_15359 [Moniliophthora roreri MCA 2997]
MGSLQGSSNFTIHGGQFTHVQGNQHIVNVNEVPLHPVSLGDSEKTIWDDYNRVRTGNVYVTRVLGETELRRKETRNGRALIARRIVSVARIAGEDKESEFLYVTYRGRDAFKAFKRDFVRFSSIKHPNVAQLFGYNDNEQGLPALIFYNALIPLRPVVFVQNRLSPILYAYFAYQFNTTRIAQGRVDLDELWIDPRTGALCRGPYNQLSSSEYWIRSGFEPNSMLRDHFPPASVHTYSDTDAMFDYLTRTLTTRSILRGINWTSGGFREWLNDEEAVSMLPLLTGAVYNIHRKDVIARWTGARERLFYELWKVQDAPEAMCESHIVMEDGSVRLTANPMDIRNLRSMRIGYDISPRAEWYTLAESWLGQAHSVFSRLGIRGDEWDDYFIHSATWLDFQRKEHASSHVDDHMPPVYLFIQPIPQPSEGETVWRSWIKGDKYFWSLDPTGREKTSMTTQRFLGLPLFTSRIQLSHRNWDRDHHELVRKLHLHKGFDPDTTGLVRSVGLPVFDLVEEDGRFQELEDAPESHHNLEGTVYDRSMLEGPDSDEDIVLYPRADVGP